MFQFTKGYSAMQECAFLQKKYTTPHHTISHFQGLEKGGDELVSPQVTK